MENREVKYNSGNLAKYKSANPLKQKMIERFNCRILTLLGKIEKTNVLGGE